MTREEVINLALSRVSTEYLIGLAYKNQGKGPQFALFIRELAKRPDCIV